MTNTLSSAACLAEALKSAGINYVFGHPGGEVVDLIEALGQRGVEFLLTGHDSTAAFMGAAVGRLTGVPGVCLATLGPGACNLVLGVGCAYLDRDPLLAISARTAANRIHISPKQNLPLNDLFAPICKWSVALDGTGTAATVNMALAVAQAPPRGPVYLSLPADLAIRPDQPGQTLNPPPAAQSDDRQLEVVAAALNKARLPVVVIGSALTAARDYLAIRQFLSETGLPYTVLPQAKGVPDERGEMYLGTVAHGAGDAHIVERLMESDCLLGLGFDPVESAHDWHFRRPLYSLANWPISFGEYAPQAQCTGDLPQLLQQLRALYRGEHSWTAAHVIETRRKVTAAMTPAASASQAGLSPYHLMKATQQAVPADTVVCVDVGAHKMLMGQAWLAQAPNSFLVSNGLSAMGYGLSAALAACLVKPRQPVVAVLGDGGFAMKVQELETARRLGLNPLIIVLCDRSLAVIKLAQDVRGIGHRGVDFGPVDWARVAEGFLVRGLAANKLPDVERAVMNWLTHPEPTVVAVAIDETLYSGLT